MMSDVEMPSVLWVGANMPKSGHTQTNTVTLRMYMQRTREMAAALLLKLKSRPVTTTPSLAVPASSPGTEARVRWKRRSNKAPD